MGEEESHGDGHLRLSPSLRFVHYSCGSCGYHLNLNSCNRHTPLIGSDYEKSIRRGIISFFSIDESRFSQVEQVKYRPYFTSKLSWGLLRRRTKLLCRKCGAHVGNSEKQTVPSSQLPLAKVRSVSWDGMSESRMFNIKIRALQPSPSEDFIAIAIAIA